MIVSKVFDRSINKTPAQPFLSRHNLYLTINNNKAYFVLNSLLYLQKNGGRNFPIVTEIFAKDRKLNIVYITQPYFSVLKGKLKFQIKENFNKFQLIIHQILILKTL